MFVKRNADGVIVAVSSETTADISEPLPPSNPELAAFLLGSQTGGKPNLEDSDRELARVLEDLIDLLIESSVIKFTDLPAAAQAKILGRKGMRKGTQGLGLLDEENGVI